MNSQSTSDETLPADLQTENLDSPQPKNSWRQAWEKIVRLGLGEIALRTGTAVVSLALILVVIWVMATFFLKGDASNNLAGAAVLAAPGTVNAQAPTPTAQPPAFVIPQSTVHVNGITRLAQLHTLLPSRPRYDVITYTVLEGDTIFGIAEKFGLKPQSILLGNRELLGDNPHYIQPGMVLNILPSDGIYYRWNAGDGLNGVSSYYKVTPEVIVNWPGNHLDPATLGDWSNPNIADGTMLFVPGGQAEFITWSAPVITRDNPGVARLFGPGYCGVITTGAVGDGLFVWPTVLHYLSGYDYTPDTNHYGLDFAGQMGTPIYAIDDGVVVYSGWNDHGYGYVMVIDHGNGWQSLYAHLSEIYFGCGQSVFSGDTIAAMGSTGRSTGPHLHFELRYNGNFVNPWNVLP